MIQEVEALPKREGMPHALKDANRTGNVLYNSTWIAGVDYDKELFDGDNCEEEDNYDEEDQGKEDNGHYDPMDPDKIAGLVDVEELNQDKNQQESEADNSKKKI